MTGKSIKEKLGEIKQAIGTTTNEIRVVKKEQTDGIKSEFKDIERLRHHKDLIYYKSDALAIIIRKLGGFDEFLAIVEELTKEGYRMMNSEDVKNLMSNFGINLPGVARGTLYYFQNKKYII